MVFRAVGIDEVAPPSSSDIAIGIDEVVPPPTRTFVLQKVGVTACGAAWRANVLRLRHDETVEFDDAAAHGSWSVTPDGITLLITFHFRGDVTAMKQSIYNRIPGTNNVFIQVHCDVRHQNILIEV